MQAPDDLYMDLVMVEPPGEDNGAILMNVCYSGPKADAERVLAPLRKAGKPLADDIKAAAKSLKHRSRPCPSGRRAGGWTHARGPHDKTFQ